MDGSSNHLPKIFLPAILQTVSNGDFQDVSVKQTIWYQVLTTGCV